MAKGGTHSQAVVGEEISDPVAAFHLVGSHLHALEEAWEVGSCSHQLRTNVEVLLLQPRELVQAVRDLRGDTGTSGMLLLPFPSLQGAGDGGRAICTVVTKGIKAGEGMAEGMMGFSVEKRRLGGTFSLKGGCSDVGLVSAPNG